MTKISTSLNSMITTGNIVVVQTAEMRAQGVISVQLGDQQITLSQQQVARNSAGAEGLHLAPDMTHTAVLRQVLGACRRRPALAGQLLLRSRSSARRRARTMRTDVTAVAKTASAAVTKLVEKLAGIEESLESIRSRRSSAGAALLFKYWPSTGTEN